MNMKVSQGGDKRTTGDIQKSLLDRAIANAKASGFQEQNDIQGNLNLYGHKINGIDKYGWYDVHSY